MGQARRQGGAYYEAPMPNMIDYNAIIVDGDPDALLIAASQVGAAIKRVKNSQIRGIFFTVRQIQLNWPANRQRAYRDAVLLRPRIGYAAERNDLAGLDEVLSDALAKVSDPDNAVAQRRFGHFVEFFEAIIAYHKMNGGRDK